MALPKRRQSKARGRKRRTHYKATAISSSPCPQCGQPKIPHRICSYCGYYKGKAIISVTE